VTINAFTDLQDAIGAASPGNEIWVADGTYVLSSGLSVNKEVSIYGGFQGNSRSGGGETQRSQRNWQTYTTTVDGDSHSYISCFYIWDKCTTIDGFTISGGQQNYGYGISCNGGSTTITNCTITHNSVGISCSSSSSPTIVNCTFSANGHVDSPGYYSGGGISISGSSSPTITGCTFSQNLNCGIDVSSTSSSTITNCVFSGNTRGGTIFSSSPTITGCVFSGNNNTGSGSGYEPGGGINILLTTSSSPTITDCVFSGNTAAGNGEAIATNSGNSYFPIIDRCVFSGNVAGKDGGGFYTAYCTPKLTNCLFINNQADNGGGIAAWRSNGSTVINCTFYGNASSGTYSDRGGGAVYAKAATGYPCATTLTNCILWGNTAANTGHEVYCIGGTAGSSVVVTLNYCDIQNTTNWKYEQNAYSKVNDQPDSIYHNIYTNPSFVNTSVPKGSDNIWATSDDGFMIQSGSGCKNKGKDVTGYPDYIILDITGNPRKINNVVDIGAYECPN
jgi:parallel beta-helix repeat protein/predicted outer membrane repeat protein